MDIKRRWRFTTSNTHYYTYIEVYPYYVLTKSEYVANKIISSDQNGNIISKEIETGEYILQETKAPTIVDGEGRTTEFILDENKYIVTIDKYGKATIDGINEKDENIDAFIFKNQRNKGQITITKKWIDDVDNDKSNA